MQACKHNDVACCQNYTAFVRQNPCPTICNMFPFFTLILHHSSDTTHLTHLTTLSETHLPATPPPSPQVHSFMLLTLYVIQPCLFARFFCEVGSIMLQQPSCVSFMLQNCFPNFLFIFYTEFVFPLIIAFPLFFSLLTLNCLFIILC